MIAQVRVSQWTDFSASMGDFSVARLPICFFFFCGKNGVSSPAVQTSWVGNPAHGTPCAPRVSIIALEFMILSL